MFKLFKNKNKTLSLLSPVKGRLIELAEVNDPVFSGGMMGQGFAVKPEAGDLVSPVSGTVQMVAETKHGIGIKTSEGVEVLVHLGLDTVELEGKPFEIKVAQGENINAGDSIGTMKVNDIVLAGKDPTVIVVVTNSDDVVQVIEVSPKSISAGGTAAQVTLK